MKLWLPDALDELIYSLYRRFLWTDRHRYRAISPLFGGNGRFRVNCTLAVDGFARSGNTFVADMLRATQRPDFTFESHHHIPPFIMDCCAHGTPTVLLVREPVDSVISLALHSGWSLRKSLDHYVAYHKCLLPYRSKVHVARFTDFTHDFQRFVLDVNARFGLQLNVAFDHAAVAAGALAAMDQRLSRQGKPLTAMEIHRPTEERRHLKIDLIQKLRVESLQKSLFEAESLYAAYTAACTPAASRDDLRDSRINSAA